VIDWLCIVTSMGLYLGMGGGTRGIVIQKQYICVVYPTVYMHVYVCDVYIHVLVCICLCVWFCVHDHAQQYVCVSK